MRWWLGEVAWVTGAAPTMVPDRVDPETGERWTATADDLAYFTLEMASGAIAQVFLSGVAATSGGNDTAIYGSKGTLTLSNGDERLWFAKAGAGRSRRSPSRTPTPPCPASARGSGTSASSARCASCAAPSPKGRPLREGASFHDGLANQRVLDAVRLSGAERRSVRPDDVDA